MDRQQIISELNNIISDYIKVQGLVLVDLIYRYEARDLVLRILVDRPEGGVSLGECARMNNEISEILDGKDILQARYVLEVSSPGIDRPLVTGSDFLRCVNRRARFFLNETINGKLELEGTIIKVEDDAVFIDIEGESIKVPLSRINKAKQVVDII